jgi:hypothetical protein
MRPLAGPAALRLRNTLATCAFTKTLIDQKGRPLASH